MESLNVPKHRFRNVLYIMKFSNLVHVIIYQYNEVRWGAIIFWKNVIYTEMIGLELYNVTILYRR